MNLLDQYRAESLLECGGFDPVDQLERYVRWYREGYYSSTGVLFDIGGTVRTALKRFEATRDPWSGSTDPQSAGSGSVMRSRTAVFRGRPRRGDCPRAAYMTRDG